MNILQGEIWEVDLNPTIGDEMSKKRVCLVVNSDSVGILNLGLLFQLLDGKTNLNKLFG